MSKPRPDQSQETRKPTSNKPLNSVKYPSAPKPGSPMDRFNEALRKILAVPKKGAKK